MPGESWSARHHRWVIVAVLVIALIMLGQCCLAELSRPPWLGLRAASAGNHLVITWVQPAGLGWDAGIRPGDTVTTIDGRSATARDSSAVTTAVEIQTRATGGKPRIASTTLAAQTSSQRELSFLAIAACFTLVGGSIFVLAVDIVVASTILGFAIATATMLLAAIATPFGATWSLAIEYVAVVAFGAGAFLTFLVFPINHLATRPGRGVALVCIDAGLALIVGYIWAVVISPAAYAILRDLTFTAVTLELGGAGALAIRAVAHSSAERSAARRTRGLLALGTVAGLAPFCLLSLGPYLLGFGYLVDPDDSILAVILLPIGLEAAVLSRQFLGTTRLVRRGFIALVIWLLLLAVYSIAFNRTEHTLDVQNRLLAMTLNSTILDVAIVAATFPLLQRWLRRWLEQTLFHDVYDYAATLQSISSETARLTSVATIAEHVLSRLGKTLDLSWATLSLGDAALPRWFYRWGDDPTDLEMAAVDACQHLCVPMVAEGNSIGTLAVGPKRHDLELLPEDQQFITTLAPLVAAALQNAELIDRLEEQVATLRDRERTLRALSLQIMRAQEEERHRIALDLHDDPLQRLILLTRELKSGPQDDRFPRWIQAVEETSISLRAACLDLHPPMLDDLGLVSGLEWLIADLSARSDLPTSLRIETADHAPFGRLDRDLEVALYRVVQEALNNCLKHAEATRAVVTLSRNHERIALRIADDGRGCSDFSDTDQSIPLGLLGARERLRPWGGLVTMEANPTDGTTLLVEIPHCARSLL